MDDIKVLNLYIKQQRLLTYSNLIENYSSSNWKELASLTLISLLLLNRRRPGELERTLLTDLRNYQTVSEDQNFELYEGFTNSERVAARNYGRITIRGKLCLNTRAGIPISAQEITRMSTVLGEARGNIQKEADISFSSVNACIFEESGCSSSDIL
ncbi:hypothetical protein WA026_014215 [Henosepilachna vigintioctopunctata]|uniref:Uncharacterized protein n=1 Tax=Henosepilachna vigintioctopunctata TaxID=420089 RepID=A0AAW1TVB6_9CUCU